MTNSSLIPQSIILISAGLALLAPMMVSAQVTRHWTPQGSSNNWHDANNWTPAGVPGILDDVIQDNGQRTISLANGSTSGIDSLIISQSGRIFTSGSTLNINAENENGTLTIVGSGSELIVEPSLTTSADADVDFVDLETGGRLRMAGGSMRIDRELFVDTQSRISGFGNIHFDLSSESQTPTVLNVEGTIQALGGALQITTEEFAYTDIMQAHLDAGFGDLILDVETISEVQSIMTIGAGHFIKFNRQILLGEDAVVNLIGGDSNQEATLINELTLVRGKVNVSGSTSLQGIAILASEADVELPSVSDRLRVAGSLGIFADSSGAGQSTISGLGVVEIESGSEFFLINGPTLEATVVNSGLMNLASGGFGFSSDVGSAEFNNVVQTEFGTTKYDIAELGGFTLADGYLANGVAELGGKLEVTLVEVDGIEPEIHLGDVFPVLTASGGVFGRYSEVVLPELADSLFWQLNYGATTVELVVSDFVLGDVNGDGQIDLLDISPFVEAVTSGVFTPSADINQDTVVDLLDVEPFIDLIVG